MKKVPHSKLKEVREFLLDKQNRHCAACGADFRELTYRKKYRGAVPKYRPHLDHNHKTGYIRGVLCHVCNGLEGKITNYLESYGVDDINMEDRVSGIIKYLKEHTVPKTKYLHPTYKTEEEKKTARQKKVKRLKAEKNAIDLLQQEGS